MFLDPRSAQGCGSLMQSEGNTSPTPGPPNLTGAEQPLSQEASNVMEEVSPRIWDVPSPMKDTQLPDESEPGQGTTCDLREPQNSLRMG